MNLRGGLLVLVLYFYFDFSSVGEGFRDLPYGF